MKDVKRVSQTDDFLNVRLHMITIHGLHMAINHVECILRAKVKKVFNAHKWNANQERFL